MAVSDPFQQINADFIHADAVTDQPPGARQIMLVPGGDVAALSLELPKGLRGQSREQVAHRQLRDQIGLEAGAIEMRPMRARAGDEDWTRVLVADPELVAAWRTRAGPDCRAVLPDYLALPTAPDLWSMAATPQGVAVRLGPRDGFGAPEDTALALFDRALRDADPAPKAVLCLGHRQTSFETLCRAHGIALIDDMAQAQAFDLAPAQVLGHGELLMDLRRDPQMARSALARRVLPWRWPVLLALVASALWGLSQYIIIDRIDAETRAISTQTNAMVQEHFVKTGPILDARIQVSQALAKLQEAAAGPQTGVDPMRLFNRAADIIAARQATVRSATLTTQDTISVVLQVPDFAAAEQVAAALSQGGLEVEVVDTRVSEGARDVRSELRITPAPEANP